MTARVMLAALACVMLATSTVTRPVRLALAETVASIQKEDLP